MVQIYQQHTFLLNISVSDGMKLVQEFFTTNPLDYNLRNIEHECPHQAKSSIVLWKIYAKNIKRIFSTQSRKLHKLLGMWTIIAGKWNWLYNPNTIKFYKNKALNE